jgi:hypothetical protein
MSAELTSGGRDPKSKTIFNPVFTLIGFCLRFSRPSLAGLGS